MDAFYTTVVAIAFVLLLFVLIVVGIMMQKQDADKVYPAYASKCPDGWGISDTSGCLVPLNSSPNYPALDKLDDNNDFGADKTISESDFSGSGTSASATYMIFNSNATPCQKKAIANKMEVSWDGITNYNKCT